MRCHNTVLKRPRLDLEGDSEDKPIVEMRKIVFPKQIIVANHMFHVFRKNIPLLGACGAIIAMCLLDTARRLSTAVPAHRWESALVAEGYRALLGMPVYEEPIHGHATHMYGPLTTYLAAVLFRLTGPSVYPLRLFSLCAAFGCICLVVKMSSASRQPLATAIGVAMLFSLGQGVTDYVEPRPDLSSLLLSLLSLFFLYRGYQQQRWAHHFIGVSLLVCAFLFKQPSAMICAIPVVAVLIQKEWPSKKQVRMLASPFCAIAITFLSIYTAFPMLYHFMFQVPSRYGISLEQIYHWAVKFPLSMPVVWLTFALWLNAARQDCFKSPKLCWILAAISVTVPCGIVMAAKQGGMVNNLLPAGFACVTLLLYCGKGLDDMLDEQGQATGLRRLVFSGVVAGLLIVGFFDTRLGTVRSNVFYGDQCYGDVVQFIANSQGPVTCPQDPSLVACAGRPPGRSVALENDAQLYPSKVPDYFFDDLKNAQYAIAVGREGDWRTWPLTAAERDEIFSRYGFRPVAVNPFANSVYTLWEKITIHQSVGK